MLKQLKKLTEKHGAAQVCVWIGITDTRTLNTWLSREQIPYKYLFIVEKLLKKKGER
jgi:hypothetical protein